MKINEEDWLKWMDEISDNGFVIIDDFLEFNLLQQIHDFFNIKLKEDDFKKASIGSGAMSKKIPEIRGDYIYWLDRDKDAEISDFFTLSDDIIFAFNRYCFLSLKASEFHLAEYPRGSFYKKHVDQFEGRSNRIITFLLYLNPNWQDGDGGELRMYLDDRIKDVAPIENRCILFQSEKIMHEVIPTNIVRRSLTGWLLHNPPVVASILD